MKNLIYHALLNQWFIKDQNRGDVTPPANVCGTVFAKFYSKCKKTELTINSCIICEEICEDTIKSLLLEDIYSFLCLTVIGKSADNVKINIHLHHRILAIDQEILYLSSSFRYKPCWYVGLII